MAYPETMSEISGYPKALSHAESGGGGDVSVKTLNVTNGSNERFSLRGALVGGKYGTIEIATNSTVAVQYVEPIEDYMLSCDTLLQMSGTQPEGVTIASATIGCNIYINSEVADGTAVTFTVNGDDES